jgi:hypothetical protein
VVYRYVTDGRCGRRRGFVECVEYFDRNYRTRKMCDEASFFIDGLITCIGAIREETDANLVNNNAPNAPPLSAGEISPDVDPNFGSPSTPQTLAPMHDLFRHMLSCFRVLLRYSSPDLRCCLFCADASRARCHETCFCREKLRRCMFGFFCPCRRLLERANIAPMLAGFAVG